MNITPLDIYWITRLDNLNLFFFMVSILSFFPLCFSLALVYELKSDGALPFLRVSVLVFIISTVIIPFIPTTKEVAAMILIPKIVNNEKVKRIPDKFVTLADEWLEELRPEKDKENK